MPISRPLLPILFALISSAWVVIGQSKAVAELNAGASPAPRAADAPNPKNKKKKKRVASPEGTNEKIATVPTAGKPNPTEKVAEQPTKSTPSPHMAAAGPAELLPQLADSTPPSKIAISSFVVEGDNPPAALVYQLQDGFVLGLVRAGVRVIDNEDLKNKLKEQPALLGCDTSPCLKQLGQEVGVRYVVRVQVSITGNSYRMSARVFRTTGPAPAALPIETQSRFCDVCTVTEAREAMLRLADGIRVPDEPSLAGVEGPAPRPLPYRPSKKFAMSSVAVGIASVIAGTVMLAASGDRDKGLHALGGAFMGAGALTSIGGLYLYGEAVRPLPAPPAPPPVRPTAE